MASNLRRLIYSHVLDKMKSSRENVLDPNTFSLKYNKLSNDIELHVPTNLSLSTTKFEIKGVHSTIETTDQKGKNNLIFKVDKPKFLSEVLGSISSNPTSFWRNSDLIQDIHPHKVLVEFSSPNIAKPFHMGHLRSTIIGNFISNLHASLGHDVVRINYLGDWGTQFGFLNVGLELNQISDEEIARSPIQTLYDAYVSANKKAETDPSIQERAREIFRQLEEGSFPELEIWERFRQYTVQELESTYHRLGVKFDEYQWESMFGAKEIKGVLNDLKSRGILSTVGNGKQVAHIRPDRQVTLVKSDGSTLYLTRDVAAARHRYAEHQFGRLLYVVDNSQSDHFSAMTHILEGLGHSWASRIGHVKFGRVRGMSTRKGEAVFLRDILDEACNRVRARQEKTATTRNDLREDTADILAVSAVLVNDLKQRRQRDYDFDWDKALMMQGDGGIKLQYTHCRLHSLEEKSDAHPTPQCNAQLIPEPSACALVTELARFDQVLAKCYAEMESCILVNYLFSLSTLVNHAFQHLPVKDQSSEIASQRLLLFHSARQVLHNGLCILGLKPLERM